MKSMEKMVIAMTLLGASVCYAHGVEANNGFIDKSPVVYLYKDDFGNAYTYESRDRLDNLFDVGIRYVNEKELAALEKNNIRVNFVRENDEFSSEADDIESRGATINAYPILSSIPSNFSIVQLGGVVYGNFFVSGSQPSGKTTQWVAYNFSSTNMSNFGSHMAIGLLVDYNQYYSNYPPTYSPALVGNGLIIGNVAGTPNGCGFGVNTTPVYNMEVESYWNGGNRLYPNTCSSSGLSDNTTYYVQIHANTLGYVAYGVTGGMSWTSPSPYTIPDRPSGSAGTLAGGGVFFGLVGVPSVSQTISLNFVNAGGGWF